MIISAKAQLQNWKTQKINVSRARRILKQIILQSSSRYSEAQLARPKKEEALQARVLSNLKALEALISLPTL